MIYTLKKEKSESERVCVCVCVKVRDSVVCVRVCRCVRSGAGVCVGTYVRACLRERENGSGI